MTTLQKDIKKKYPSTYIQMLDIARMRTGEDKYIQCKIWHGDKETIGFVYHIRMLKEEVLNVCYQQLVFSPNKPSIYRLEKECRFNILPE